MQAFKQVQLLVSDNDVNSYKQIKEDLDGLRLLVEKSELWVYKAKSADDKSKPEAGKEDEDEAQDAAAVAVDDKKDGVTAVMASANKQGSAINLDIGPPLEQHQARNYKSIQQVG